MASSRQHADLQNQDPLSDSSNLLLTEGGERLWLRQRSYHISQISNRSVPAHPKRARGRPVCFTLQSELQYKRLQASGDLHQHGKQTSVDQGEVNKSTPKYCKHQIPVFPCPGHLSVTPIHFHVDRSISRLPWTLTHEPHTRPRVALQLSINQVFQLSLFHIHQDCQVSQYPDVRYVSEHLSSTHICPPYYKRRLAASTHIKSASSLSLFISNSHCLISYTSHIVIAVKF